MIYMNEKDCEVCKKMIKAKYKHYRTWQVLAIVFICVAVLFAILYFASGNILSTTTIEYENIVDIQNGGDNNTNTENGNIIIEKQNDGIIAVILISVLILSGGIVCGCYIIAQKNNKN